MEFMSDLPDIVRMLVALILVIALMGGLALALKRLGLSGAQPLKASGKRLAVIEKLPLDPRRQLVLLQRDNIQHLVILSTNGETVIETGIKHDDAN
jgi:flagellar biogenesis protein FliO